MNVPRFVLTGISILLLTTLGAFAEVKVTIGHNRGEDSAPGFSFGTIPSPSRTNAATNARFTLIDGEADSNSAGLDVLHNGKLATEEDEPARSFFFAAGSRGGRIAIDLGESIEIKRVGTYSWHNSDRAPQVYQIYAGDGSAKEFNPAPGGDIDPSSCGWEKIASVDTRPKSGEIGGQYGVVISDSSGVLGKYRYLLFVVSRTEDRDRFGNTFYNAINVIANGATEAPQPPPMTAVKDELTTADGIYHITVDTSETPELTAWARGHLEPVVREWYPNIVGMLPSEGFEAPKKLSITFKAKMGGVADTSGTRIRCAAQWFQRNLDGEAVGSVVHELVHVVQQYGVARRNNPDAARNPGWLVEGLADYIRWYQYEPQSHGAEIRKSAIPRARYNASYRVTANFLNWTVRQGSPDLIRKLNAAMREGKYGESVWQETTGHTVTELGASWKSALEKSAGGDSTH